ncbi:MAG TPA: diadenosine tetraphosphate hydrolase, partial [Candidatus Poseidoniales archaeon]
MSERTLFTRIIEGEIPCYKLYENEHVFAFLDINPL